MDRRSMTNKETLASHLGNSSPSCLLFEFLGPIENLMDRINGQIHSRTIPISSLPFTWNRLVLSPLLNLLAPTGDMIFISVLFPSHPDMVAKRGHCRYAKGPKSERITPCIIPEPCVQGEFHCCVCTIYMAITELADQLSLEHMDAENANTMV